MSQPMPQTLAGLDLYDKAWETAAHYAMAKGYRGDITPIAAAIEKAANEKLEELAWVSAGQEELFV